MAKVKAVDNRESELYNILMEDITLENLQKYKEYKMMRKFWLRFDKEVIDRLLTCGKEVI